MPPDRTGRDLETPVTVGTAGHIDHGKTSLVERLTGMRADRPYERERGMTIDIGYAEMEVPGARRIGFVDLPGHERFVRNMVAGATGIDLALLVVAADDGVMPQTREHAEILGLLGVRKGLAVLTKVDLVDAETRALAREELSEFLQGTSLAGIPVLESSAESGEGVEEVKSQLVALVGGVRARREGEAFYCAVQRTFAAAGFGCIVTGVPASGAVAVGDEVELLPAGKRARVRAIEIYHRPAQSARAGHRTALNLAGVHHEEVGRGMAVAAPGFFTPTRHVAVRLQLLPSARKPLRHAARVRLLTGTLEEMAAIYLPEGSALRPGDSRIVEVRTKAPVAVRDGDAFIVRSENARETLGGGRVVSAMDSPLGRRSPERVRALERWEACLDDPVARVRAALEESGTATAATLAVRCKLSRERTTAILDAMQREGELVALSQGSFVPRDAVEQAAARVRETLRRLHEESPLLEALPLAQVRDEAGLDEARMAAALASLEGEVEIAARTVRLTGHQVRLDPEIARASEAVLATMRDARFAPPRREKLPDAAGLPPAQADAALTVLTDRGAVREVAPGLLYSKEILDEGVRILHTLAQKRGNFEPVDAKAALGGISRKWLIPLLEFYDRLGATRRNGNARILTRRGEAMAEGGIDAV